MNLHPFGELNLILNNLGLELNELKQSQDMIKIEKYEELLDLVIDIVKLHRVN